MFRQRRLFAFLGILAGLILVQACGRQLPPQASCNFVQNQSLRRVSWNKNVPVDLYLDASVPYDYVSSIQSAVTKWNQVGQKLQQQDFFKLKTGNPGSTTPAQDGYTKIYVLNDWEASRPTEQARTTVYWTGSRIYEADMRINNKNFQYFTSETPDYSRVHLESLVVHELGHILGLAHTDAEDSVMQVTLANGKLRETPGSTDVSSLKCEY